VSDDKDDVDPSDWLASQFDPTKEVPKQKPATPPVQPSAQTPIPPSMPAAPFAAWPPAAAPASPAGVPVPRASPPPAPLPSTAPPPAAQGGFNWGLRPGGEESAAAPTVPPPAAPPASTPSAAQLPAGPPAPPPLIEPPLPAHGAHAAPPPTSSADVPTQAMTQPMSWDDIAAVQRPAAPAEPPKTAEPDAYVGQPTEAYSVQPWDPFEGAAFPSTAPPAAPFAAQPADVAPFAGSDEPTSALDSLFGETRFQEYEEIGVLQTISPLAGTSQSQTDVGPVVRAPLSHTQKILMWVAGALVAILAIIALFLLGQKLGAAAAAPAPVPASTSAASATPVPAATGVPAAVGTQPWTALNGGECIKPFTSAWAVTFTVVDCGGSHTAQMLFKGTLPNPAASAYPTGAQFQTEITPLCSAATVINYGIAKAVNDLQVSFSYPAGSGSWDSNDRTYYCFVSRKSGGDLPGNLSVK
jgi:hypothetical protein